MSDSAKSELVVSDLHVRVGGQMVLNGVDLRVASGEVHAVMGPNGSGKSTLAYAIMGRPGYEITAGSITLNGVDLVDLAPWERAHAGLFSTQQYPTEVPGVGLENMLEEAVAAARETGDALRVAHAVRHLGQVRHRQRRWDQARACYREALDLYEKGDDTSPLDHANALRPMALLLEDRGDADAAASIWREAARLYRAAGVAAGVEECEARMGRR